jgi:RND family efflux transporter MFP subunit
MTYIRSFEKLGSGILLAFLTLTLLECGSQKKEEPNTSNGPELSTAVVPIEVAVAERKNISVSRTFSGTLEGEEQANIVAKISERVTGIAIHVGEAVVAGQVTITLDKSGASSQYYQAEANFKNAEKTLERMKSLYAEGAISLQTVDGTQTAYDVAKANFDAARSTVELTTPIPGVVTAVHVSVGDISVPGSVLATVAKIARMKVIFNINETDVTNFSIGQRVQVYSESTSDVKVDGQIVQLSKSADIRSRSFEIKAVFPNTSNRWFKPGMFCRVTVDLAPRQKTLVVSNAALQSDGVTNRVYVVRKGRAFLRVVQVGVTDGQNSEILQGLAERDTVATVGVTNLKDSSVVSVASRTQ